MALLDPARREEITRGSVSPSGSMHRKTQFVVTECLPRTLKAALTTLPLPIPLEWGLTVVVGVRAARLGVSSVTSLVATWSLPGQPLMLSFSSVRSCTDRQGAVIPCQPALLAPGHEDEQHHAAGRGNSCACNSGLRIHSTASARRRLVDFLALRRADSIGKQQSRSARTVCRAFPRQG